MTVKGRWGRSSPRAGLRQMVAEEGPRREGNESDLSPRKSPCVPDTCTHPS